MQTIGEIAKSLGTTPRTIRHYEDQGLLQPKRHDRNDYRIYGPKELERLRSILSWSQLGFSLKQIQTLLESPLDQTTHHLQERLNEIDRETQLLQTQRKQIRNQILACQEISKIDSSIKKLGPNERESLYQASRSNFYQRVAGRLNPSQLQHLERDPLAKNDLKTYALLESVTRILDFAKKQKIILGPARGSSPSSLMLHGLGWTPIDPLEWELYPERVTQVPPDLHIDVEFEKGDALIEFCHNQNRSLIYGQINAFKMPLLNIIDQSIQKTSQKKLPVVDPAQVLKNISEGEIEYIFCLDRSKTAIINRFEAIAPEFKDNDKIKSYLREHQPNSYRDLLNIVALWRPNAEEKIHRIYRYAWAKKSESRITLLSPEIQEFLKPNYGQIIYHEEITKIIQYFTRWDHNRACQVQRDLFLRQASGGDLEELESACGPKVLQLLVEEAPWTFCLSHMTAFGTLIWKTAILKTASPEIYTQSAQAWEEKFGYAWDDIGIRKPGISLLQ